ncbi:uncharacterized protein G2W53_023856 [Senna tora]|uniref:Uncharacterized protein n=1 Tax=Senna tora TaxID=362788 RepID=A0A834TC48_9FABA|nr:uncharacterized protein G2W53_023856 [Senna tora]
MGYGQLIEVEEADLLMVLQQK